MNSLIIVFCAVSVISFAICDDERINYVSTPWHGTNNAAENVVSCPDNGCITAISVSTFGPYGEGSGTAVSLTCPPGQCVSEFFGMAGKYLSALSIRCRPANVLEGEGTAVAGSAQGIYAEKFPTFDDRAFAYGARPTGVRIKCAKDIESIQVQYINRPADVCEEGVCKNYNEVMGEFYGQKKGKATVLACPDRGEMRDMEYSYTSYYITSVRFRCASTLSETTIGPVGSGEGTKGSLVCPPGMIIGAFHGRYTHYLAALGIYCVLFGGNKFAKFDAFGGIPNGYKIFDEKSISDRGYRAVSMIFWWNNELESIVTRYANAPHARDCVVTQVDITDTNLVAEDDGFEVIGISAASSCSLGTKLGTGKQVLKLTYARSFTETISLTTSKNVERNFATELSVTTAVAANAFGGEVEFSLRLSASVGGAISYSTSDSSSNDTTTACSGGTEITFTTPGACVVVGYVNRYKINRNKVPVNYHFTCKSGSMPPRKGEIDLKSKRYGKAYFVDYQFQFENVSHCTQQVRTCVKEVEELRLMSDMTNFEKKFKACFPNGSGAYNGKKVL